MLKKENLAPFISILLARDNNAQSSEVIHQTLIDEIAKTDRLVGEYEVQEFTHSIESIQGDESILVKEGTGYFSHYTIQKKPSWLSSVPSQPDENNDSKNPSEISSYENTENHLLVSIKLGSYWAFYASEDGVKHLIRELLLDNETLKGNVSPLTISHLQALFVNEENLKVLWMNDIRGQYSFAPSSKTISGKGLADKLNPLFDQSYMMSASRTDVKIKEKVLSIGVSPFKSVVWSRNCLDWETFENDVVRILDHINDKAAETEHPISALAYPIAELTDLDKAYAFSIVDKDSLDVEPDDVKYKLLEDIEENFSYEVDESHCAFGQSKEVELKVKHKGDSCCCLLIKPLINKYKVTFNVEIKRVDKKEETSLFLQLFKNSNSSWLKCWYDSNHAIVGGMAFKTEFRDVDFTSFLWDNFERTGSNYFDLTKEKPLNPANEVDLNLIGTSDSLFCWVQNHWSGQWSHGNPKLPDGFFKTTGKPTGLLICDDGAGEVADFIHIEAYEGVLYTSFIHVKSAGKSANRGLSVGVHDVVINQAIKNLVMCDRKDFIDIIRDRDGNNNKKCWENGNQRTFQQFESSVQTIMNNYTTKKTRVIVVQPHTPKTKFHHKPINNRGKQLHTLLVAAESAIKTTGAEFYVVGFDDT
ncbi:hypothetical protein [Thalassotalea montiporae]